MDRAPGRRPDYSELIRRAREELQRGAERHVGLQLLCDLLHEEVPHYDWVGFYLVAPGGEMLVLGPYQGASTDHVRIPRGVGVCGQAAERGETIIVPDVRQEGNYLACSIHVRSEIVVPVLVGSTVIAEIDIDSHSPAAFTEEDRLFLEALAPLTVAHVPPIPDQDGTIPPQPM
jgi:L-methionine (R)-S-oxide reductase